MSHWVPVLHAHLPFVRHPEASRFLEEEWLFEALAESYWPLVWAFERLHAEGVAYALTLSVSPTLGAMLADPLLHERYCAYLDERLVALVGERERLSGEAQELVAFYVAHYEALLARAVEGGPGGWLRAVRRLATSGGLELITTSATHGYLPLLAAFGLDVGAQLSTAIRAHRATFGGAPAGMWLPECGYYDGLGQELSRRAVGYIFVERHALLHADPRPQAGIHRPVRTPEGVVVFARDYESALQVWSSVEGYPGDADYRDFYRDAGFDSDAAHILRLRHGAQPTFTGLKYHAVGVGDSAKPLYRPSRGRERAQVHARDFVERRVAQAQDLRAANIEAPVLVTPYDAELLGHWWFEGPWWLEAVFRELARRDAPLEAACASTVAQQAGELQTVRVAESSWGEGGYHRVWLNPKTDWIYPRLVRAAAALRDASTGQLPASPLIRRALSQAVRELLLAESSDWPFMLTRGSSSDYARRRVVEHLDNVESLAVGVLRGGVDATRLGALEARNNLFADFDLSDDARANRTD